MNLKEIIIEELEREFFGNNELHQYDKDRIEQTANNIISKMDWQVIASGVVKEQDCMLQNNPFVSKKPQKKY